MRSEADRLAADDKKDRYNIINLVFLVFFSHVLMLNSQSANRTNEYHVIFIVWRQQKQQVKKSFYIR